jgi:hypothetical protein
MLGQYMEMKIGRMRKPQNFLIFAATQVGSNEPIIIAQSDKSIGSLRISDGEFVFTNKGCYFPHLSYGKVTEIPEEYKEEMMRLGAERWKG